MGTSGPGLSADKSASCTRYFSELWTIPQADRAIILKDLSLAPAWMHPFLRDIAAADATAAVSSASRKRGASQKRRVQP